MINPICLYHRADLDGKCSGYIVSRFVPDVELLGVNYGEDVPWDQLAGRPVYLVDFSLQPWSEMERLKEIAAPLVWIDHHQSAIEEYEKSNIKINCLLDTKLAACELTWKFFSSEPAPRPVYLLGRYDVWDLDAQRDVLPFQMGMRLWDWHPAKDKEQWDVLMRFSSRAWEIAGQGRVVIEYQKRQNRGMMRKSFEHTWRDLRFLVVNAGGINSQAFESKYDPATHDAVMSFIFDGKQWIVSLYSPDQSRDLSVIAKEMGGGGHKAACGFQIKSLSEIGIGSG